MCSPKPNFPTFAILQWRGYFTKEELWNSTFQAIDELVYSESIDLIMITSVIPESEHHIQESHIKKETWEDGFGIHDESARTAEIHQWPMIPSIVHRKMIIFRIYSSQFRSFKYSSLPGDDDLHRHLQRSLRGGVIYLNVAVGRRNLHNGLLAGLIREAEYLAVSSFADFLLLRRLRHPEKKADRRMRRAIDKNFEYGSDNANLRATW